MRCLGILLCVWDIVLWIILIESRGTQYKNNEISLVILSVTLLHLAVFTQHVIENTFSYMLRDMKQILFKNWGSLYCVVLYIICLFQLVSFILFSSNLIPTRISFPSPLLLCNLWWHLSFGSHFLRLMFSLSFFFVSVTLFLFSFVFTRFTACPLVCFPSLSDIGQLGCHLSLRTGRGGWENVWEPFGSV